MLIDALDSLLMQYLNDQNIKADTLPIEKGQLEELQKIVNGANVAFMKKQFPGKFRDKVYDPDQESQKSEQSIAKS